MSRILVVDSDGCALDAMEMKHRECFIPATIATWDLEAIAPAVMEAGLHINLYSHSRGVNRFIAQVQLFQLLRKSLPQRDALRVPDPSTLEEWIRGTAFLSEGSLAQAVDESEGDRRDALGKVLDWTRDVNRRVALLPSPAAFPGVASSLTFAIRNGVRVCVVSSATRPAIEQEWRAAGLHVHVTGIFGQEDGNKTALLRALVSQVDTPRHALMVGDAIGDYEAAEANGTLFFPIIPGREAESWKRLRDPVLETFIADQLSQTDLNDRQKAFFEQLPGLD